MSTPFEEHEAITHSVMRFLESATWSSFATSLMNHFNEKGYLTEKQFAAAEMMFKKYNENVANRPSHVYLSAIKQLFENAKASGLKKPRLTIGDINIYPAPYSGRNSGCLYVKYKGDYAGKVVESGQFLPGYEYPQGVIAELEKIAADPIGAATIHGHETGNCSMCGRELTNPESIQRGIGPICAGRWGII